MTIKLLAKHGIYTANTIVTLDAPTEAGLVAAKLATTDLTGGVPYVAPPAPQNQRFPVLVEVDPAGNSVAVVSSQNGQQLSIGTSGGAAMSTALPTYSKALAELAAGVGSADVAILGDSLSVGQFAESTAYPNASTASLARLLAAQTGGTDNTFFGGIQLGNFDINNFLASDSRVTQGAGTAWQTARLGATVLGTSFSWLGTGTGAPLTFSPTDPWDTVDVYYVANTGYGSCAISGSVTGSFDSNATLAVNSLQLTKAQGVGSLTFTPTNETHIVGINFYSKSVPRLNFLKTGAGSSASANWVDNSAVYKSQQALPKLMATKRIHLWLVQIGTNDMLTSVPVATYKTNMQTLIDNLKRSATNVNGGDVVLVVPPPIPTVTAAIQASFREAIYALAETNRLLVVDNYVDFVSATYGASKGWYSTVQNVHLNATGYIELASNIRKSLGLK